MQVLQVNFVKLTYRRNYSRIILGVNDMDNKQKRMLLSLIYRTLLFISLISIAIVIFLSIKNLITSDNQAIFWLDIVMLCISIMMFLLIIIDIVTTRKFRNKYILAKFYYTITLLTFVGLIALALYVWMSEVNYLDYISYLLPIGLIVGAQIFGIIAFIVGLKITGLNRKNIIVLDENSPAPNFDDEIELKKRLDSLNRKLSIKKLQEQIQEAEKKLDE
mgnify:CR=1 FL=1